HLHARVPLGLQRPDPRGVLLLGLPGATLELLAADRLHEVAAVRPDVLRALDDPLRQAHDGVDAAPPQVDGEPPDGLVGVGAEGLGLARGAEVLGPVLVGGDRLDVPGDAVPVGGPGGVRVPRVGDAVAGPGPLAVAVALGVPVGVDVRVELAAAPRADAAGAGPARDRLAVVGHRLALEAHVGERAGEARDAAVAGRALTAVVLGVGRVHAVEVVGLRARVVLAVRADAALAAGERDDLVAVHLEPGRGHATARAVGARGRAVGVRGRAQLLVVRHEPGVAVRAGFPVARHALDADPVREDGIALAARRLAVAAAGARAGAVAHGRLAEVDVRPVVAVAVHTRRTGAVADGLDREVLALPVRLQLCLDADQAVTFAVVAAPLVRPALRDEVLGVRVTHPAEAAARAFAGQVQQEHPVLVDLGVGDGAAATTAEAAAVAAVRAAVHGLGAGVHVDVAVRPVVVVARRAAAARARGTRRRRLVVGRRHRGRRAEPADAAARAVRVGVRVVLRVVERVGHGVRREAREAVRRTG